MLLLVPPHFFYFSIVFKFFANCTNDNTVTCYFLKECLDLKNKLTELTTRKELLKNERSKLERRPAACSTSSAEPSPSCSTPSSSGATSPIPSSRSSFAGSDHPFSPPLRAHIRVLLPNKQYTVVSVAMIYGYFRFSIRLLILIVIWEVFCCDSLASMHLNLSQVDFNSLFTSQT